VIDSGFSFTYAVPFFNNIPMKHASLRIDVGGKLLTNLFCEMISTKDFNLQGEFMIVNDIKEKTCFIAEDA
jgi:actin-related protein 6